MSIDEAIAQLEFNDKKGAKIVKEVWSCMFTLLTGCYRVFVCAHNLRVKINQIPVGLKRSWFHCLCYRC